MRSWIVTALVLLPGAVRTDADSSAAPVLKRSDVVFMYQADSRTYAEYGATVLAWGGKPAPKSLQEARGVKFFGSVGMVTEFSRYYERFPETYQEGLCRDVQGQPVKVPWLTDHQHKGIPYWWCCTQQPQFRQYIRERVLETVKAGADGIHVDDHMGTSGGLWLGVCFCDRCVEGFRRHLENLPEPRRQQLKIEQRSVNYREMVRAWLSVDRNRKATQHPWWSEWTVYQSRAAAAFMAELRKAAEESAGRSVPFGANAGLLWPRHLVDYQTLDLFSAETDHHASRRAFSDTPLLAYRMAEAVGRPYAATASGGDWAFVKEQNVPGLVQGWIALSYAAGQMLMAPHRQWCYTPEKGTHWYQGPPEKFAPLYRFVREHASLFDAYSTYADVDVVMAHRSFVKNPSLWFEWTEKLARANLSYRVILAGDELVDRALSKEDFSGSRFLFVPALNDVSAADRVVLDEALQKVRSAQEPDEVLRLVQPVVRVAAAAPVRVLPRVQGRSAVVHLLNYAYDSANDRVAPIRDLAVSIGAELTGGGAVPQTWRFIQPGGESTELKMDKGVLRIAELNLWGLLVPTEDE